MGIIGENVRRHRSESKRSQAEVGQVLGINASGVSRIESGERQISAFELGLLAEAFGWDIRDLVGIERPRAKLAVAARLRAADGESTAVIARAAEIVELDSLLDEVRAADPAPGLSPDLVSLGPPPANVAEAEAQGHLAAKTLRENVGWVGPIVDLVAFAEQRLGMDVLIEKLPGECDGIVALGETCALIVVDNQVVSGRQRFSLAHEIGHGVLGDVVDTVLFDPKSIDDLAEKRAHAFASSLLMPEEEFRSVVGAAPSVTDLANAMVTFGVSWSAFIHRCDSLGMELDLALVAMTGDEVLARSGRSIEEIASIVAPIPHHVPARLSRRAQRAYGDNLIGQRVLSLVLGLEGDALDHVLSRIEIAPGVPAPVTSTRS